MSEAVTIEAPVDTSWMDPQPNQTLTKADVQKMQRHSKECGSREFFYRFGTLCCSKCKDPVL